MLLVKMIVRKLLSVTIVVDLGQLAVSQKLTMDNTLVMILVVGQNRSLPLDRSVRH